MKKFKLKKEHNDNKLMTKVSILICAIVLIVGGTFAYFTQSDSKNMDSLLTADIRDTLEYTDNVDYMRQGLIPAEVDIAKRAYSLEESRKCVDDYGYSACSVYQFNIKNIASVSQELIINMTPTINGFGNLYFILYEIDNEGNSNEIISSQKMETLTEEMIQKNEFPTYILRENLILNPNDDKTYEILFFVNDTGKDQTKEDADKSLAATIKVSSVTTGKYMIESFGGDCWETTLLSDGTYALTEFYGIDNTGVLDMNNGSFTPSDTYGNIKKECENTYIEKYNNTELYTVNVPSQIGDKVISTIGYDLFSIMKIDIEKQSAAYTNYYKIKEMNIAEGITTIEDGPGMEMTDDGKFGGAFLGIGYNLMNQSYYIEDGVNIILPNSLTTIGSSAFANSVIKYIDLPSNIEVIGSNSFSDTLLESITIPKGVHTIESSAFSHNSSLKSLTFEVDEEGNSSLKTIEKFAFSSNDNITSITIPSSVETIGNNAFGSSSNLKTVIIIDTEKNPSQLEYLSGFSNTGISNITIPSSVTTIGDSAFYSTSILSLTIPASVTTIGNSAFAYSSLTTLNFEDNSSLITIGDYAFQSTSISSLTIPASVTTIEKSAFYNNSSLTTLNFEDNSSLITIGDYAFQSTSISSLTIPASVTTIEKSAFYNNSSLTILNFEENSNLTTIGENAFQSTSISSLTIPASVTTIGNSAFAYSSLTTLNFEDNSSLITIGEKAFYFCQLYYVSADTDKLFYLPNTITTMGREAFADNPNLKFIYFEGDESGFGYHWNGNAYLFPMRS